MENSISDHVNSIPSFLDFPHSMEHSKIRLNQNYVPFMRNLISDLMDLLK